MKHYLEYKDSESGKFWSIEQSGNSFTVIYGKIGSEGTAQTKSFGSESEAEKEALKLLNSKLKKGYSESTPPDSLGKKPSVKDIKNKEPKKIEIKEPEDVVDDGKIKEWQIEDSDFWEKWFDEETFNTLKDVKSTKPVEKKKKKNGFDQVKYSKYLGQMEQYGRHANLNGFIKELEVVKQYAVLGSQLDPDPAKACGALISGSRVLESYMEYLSSTLNWITIHRKIQYNHFKIIEIIFKEIEEYEKSTNERVKNPVLNESHKNPIWEYIAKNYQKDRDSSKIPQYFESYLTGLFKNSTDVAIKLINKLIKEVKYGRLSGFEGQKILPSSISGIKISIHECDAVSISAYGDGPQKTLIERNFEGLNRFNDELVGLFALDHFKLRFKEINKEEFDSIFSNIAEIRLNGSKEVIYRTRLAETEETRAYNREMLEKANMLEQTENWKEAAEVLNEVVRHLVYSVPDSERALNIIERFLYCGNLEAENIALKTLSAYDDDEREVSWWFKRAVYRWKNFDYSWSLQKIREFALEKKYSPAIEFYHDLIDHEIIKGKEKADDENSNRSGSTKQSSIEEFENQFTESDLFRKTDNVIMRADANGQVYIRFIRESEKAYDEALDFLLHLIDKRYVCIFDGYLLHVRFVAKPEFIPKINLPRTQANAFFARAVRYKNLHEKIRQYVLTGMNQFDRYLDLEDEDCTVVGAFAASALALVDKKNLDLAIKYGKESDGEHEEIQLELAYALGKVYGVDKDTAPAIYELMMSNDHGEEIKVKDTFYKDAEVLEAFTLYLYGDNSHFRSSKIVRFMDCMFPKGGLNVKMKALKVYYDNASDAKTKNIYADFYNLVVESNALEKYNEYSFEPLDHVVAEKQTDKISSPKLTLKEKIPVVVPLKEAEKRLSSKPDLSVIEIEEITERQYVLFYPIILTDPRFLELVMTEFKRACKGDIYDRTDGGSFGGNNMYKIDDKWFIDMSATSYKYGLMVYNGKDKPAILYGALRYIDLLLKTGKRKIKEDEVSILMDQYAISEIDTPQGSQLTFPVTPEINLLDVVSSAIFNKQYNAGLINIAKLKPEDGECYKSALVYKAYILEIKLKNASENQLVFNKDIQALHNLYDELNILLPEYTDYWRNKIKKFVKD